MNSTEIIVDLQPIFSDILDAPDLRLSADTKAADVEGWDSLAQINLVVAIEKRYKVKFALDDLQELNSVGDMANLILKKLAP